MAEYQNLFTQVQAVGPANLGVPLGAGHGPRTGTDLPQVHLFGRIGMPQAVSYTHLTLPTSDLV